MIDYEKELRDRRVEVVPSGNGYVMIPCPFHLDDNPSMSVSMVSGSFRCFSGDCGKRGDFYQLIAEIDGVSDEEAQRSLRSSVSMASIRGRIEKSLDQRLQSDTLSYLSGKDFMKRFPPVVGTPGEEYLKKRGLNRATLERFRIRWGSGEFTGRVIIPILDDVGRLVAYAGRTTTGAIPKVKKQGRPSATLFGLFPLLRESDGKLAVVVLVEGEVDAMYLQQYGVPAVGVAGTSDLTAHQYRLIRKNARSCVIAFDGDDAGWKAANRELEKIKPIVPTSVVRLPRDQDPNQLSRAAISELFGAYRGTERRKAPVNG